MRLWMTNSTHHLPSIVYDQTCLWTIMNTQDTTNGNVLLLYFFSEKQLKHSRDSSKTAQIHAGLSLLKWKYTEDETHAAASARSLLCQQSPSRTRVSALDPRSSLPQTDPLHACQPHRTELSK